MKRVIRDNILGKKITVHLSSRKEFTRDMKKEYDYDMDAETSMGCRLKFTKDNVVELALWFCREDKVRIAYTTVVHESFHLLCSLRQIMYGNPELVITQDNEEDIAYQLENVTEKVLNAIISMQDSYDGVNKKAQKAKEKTY